jgi:hypothetical protein
MNGACGQEDQATCSFDADSSKVPYYEETPDSFLAVGLAGLRAVAADPVPTRGPFHEIRPRTEGRLNFMSPLHRCARDVIHGAQPHQRGIDMNRSTPLLVAAVIATGITAVHLWQQLRKERELVAQLQRLQDAAPLPRNAEQPLRGAESAIDPAGLAPPLRVEPAAPQSLPTDPVALDIELRRRNPNYIGVVQGKSGAMQLRYPDLARELGMTPEQAEALYDLLMQHERELAALPRYTGSDAALQREVGRVRQELQAKHKAEFDAAIVGREQQWQEYQPTIDARQRVSELTNMVASTSPLNESQARQLVATVLAEQRLRADILRSSAPPTANNPLAQLAYEEQSLTEREQSNRRTIESARSYLTAEQVKIMENAMNGMNQSMRASLRARRAQLEGGR